MKYKSVEYMFACYCHKNNKNTNNTKNNNKCNSNNVNTNNVKNIIMTSPQFPNLFSSHKHKPDRTYAFPTVAQYPHG